MSNGYLYITRGAAEFGTITLLAGIGLHVSGFERKFNKLKIERTTNKDRSRSRRAHENKMETLRSSRVFSMSRFEKSDSSGNIEPENRIRISQVRSCYAKSHNTPIKHVKK